MKHTDSPPFTVGLVNHGGRVLIEITTAAGTHLITDEEADAAADDLNDHAETARLLMADGGALLKEDA